MTNGDDDDGGVGELYGHLDLRLLRRCWASLLLPAEAGKTNKATKRENVTIGMQKLL